MPKQLITPWDFRLGNVDYSYIIKQFGLEPADDELISRIKDPHRLFKRKLIFAHRDFDRILEAQERGEEFVVVTGMMPSGRFHFGHKLIAELLAWYQRQGVKLYIAVSDIEACIVRGLDARECRRITFEEYVLNYLALGVDLLNTKKCCIYSQWKNYHVRDFALMASSKITLSHVQAMYGLESSSNVGKIFFPFIQVADILHPELPELGGPKPVLVPVGVDQDVHIRLARDIAPKFEMIRPSSIYIKMMCGLQGPGTKMSSSKPESAVFLSDLPEEAGKKIKNAFTGGRMTAKEQRKLGGQPDQCVPYMFLLFHFGDKILKKTFDECTSGTVLCGECKARIAEEVRRFLKEHQFKMEKARNLLPKVEELQPLL